MEHSEFARRIVAQATTVALNNRNTKRGGETMKTIIISGDGKRITRRAYAHIGENAIGELEVFDIDFKQRGECSEEVRIEYPRHAAGRNGEAQWVHLPSYPSRILYRALTGGIKEDAQ